MNKNKEVIIEKISDDLVRSLDASKVEAIEYAEIGAQEMAMLPAGLL